MAGRWVKSLQCKSRAADDVVAVLPAAASCRNSFRGLKDVVSPNQKPNPKPKPKPVHAQRRPVMPKPVAVSERFFPSLSELPEGHPSRNVVEIIFHTGWGPKAAFPGRVGMVFKIHNSSKTLARFEDYREAVKSRAGPEERDVIRCAADGNEMMRFYCLGPTNSGMVINGVGGSSWEINGAGGKTPALTSGIGTFSGSGVAHDSAGGGKGRRAMLVCRVIAGRVGERAGSGSVKGCDSVKGENGELLVVDARAVLPCFLVIYKL